MRGTFATYSTKFVILLLLGSLILFGVQQYKRYQENATINDQIQALKAEASNIETKNKELEESLQYLTSTGATERLAKQQMNLEREGEISVVFLPTETKTSEQQELSIPHWKEWWNYFFKIKT